MAKKNVRASLIVYARLKDGWRRGSLVATKAGFKSDAMMYNGVVTTVSNPTYQIRTYTGSKAQYTSAGTNLTVALETLRKVQATRQLKSALDALGIIVPKEAPKDKTLTELCEEYIAKKKGPSLDLSEDSISLYEKLRDFTALSKQEFPSALTEDDVIRYCDNLQREGYSPKTRKMRYTTVRGFLSFCGVVVEKLIDKSTHKRLSPKIEQDVEGYTQVELDRLFSVCDEYHRNAYQFLLATGMRYREANSLIWPNMDFDRNVIKLAGEQTVNRRFRSRKAGKMVNAAIVSKTKNRKGREVPIFASLRPMLLEWRKQHPHTIYVLGSKNDLPDNHWLEYGKAAWRRAGLNCGQCDGCMKHEECENFYLHKFRHSFAHRCLNKGVPIHKVSKMMGHHSIEVTAIYSRGDSTAIDVDPFAVLKVMSAAA